MPTETSIESKSFYGKVLPDPRAFYFSEKENKKIIMDGFVYWVDIRGHHWKAPIGNLGLKEMVREPAFISKCFVYNE